MCDVNEMTGYPSIDKPWLKYYSKEALLMKTPECTVYRNIYDNNKGYKNDTAILYFNKKLTYGVVFDQVEKCAKSLKKIGIEKGCCVNLCTAGIPEAIYIVLACSKIGAIANFINPLFTTEQMIERINDTETEWIFVLDELYSRIEVALPQTCINNVVILPVYNSMPNPLKMISRLKRKNVKACNSFRILSWFDFERIGDSYIGKTEQPYQKDTPVIMVYSSGTTGASKGILLTNDGINSTILSYQVPAFPYKREDTFLQMIPVWFSTGIVLSILMPLRMGITIILEPIFSKESFAKDLKKYKPTITLAATSLWLYAMDVYSSTKIDFSRFRYPTEGGEKLLRQDEIALNQFLQSNGCKRNIDKGYGMCELGSTVARSDDNKDYKSKLGGTGIPMLHAVVSAFDPVTNNELKYGEHGEIRVMSPARMKGYYKNQAATDEFFYTDEQGRVWGCTGDIGFIDEDGEVFILGRATDCATLDKGKHVYLFDIEDVILQEETLSGCKVVAVEENGKTILAAHMTVRAGVVFDKRKLAYQIHEYCKTQLPIDEVPSKYKFRTSFPVHNNGKRDNNALKAERDGFITADSLDENLG
ncbi:MAG: acyl--CoA ligase [Clostridiales bacterium]|nr:acyl--CoA ligase [Clostridiales bacterium]